MARRYLTNLALALVVTVGLMIPSVAPVAAADAPPLTGFAVCSWGSDDCNICVPDVPGAIRALRNRGDIMGFHIGDAPDPNPFADHWQGVQRTMSGGARYLLVSRSIEPASKDVSFVVVEMATRGTVKTVEGGEISLKPHTICFHADTPGALEFLEQSHAALSKAGVRVKGR